MASAGRKRACIGRAWCAPRAKWVRLLPWAEARWRWSWARWQHCCSAPHAPARIPAVYTGHAAGMETQSRGAHALCVQGVTPVYMGGNGTEQGMSDGRGGMRCGRVRRPSARASGGTATYMGSDVLTRVRERRTRPEPLLKPTLAARGLCASRRGYGGRSCCAKGLDIGGTCNKPSREPVR